VITFVLAGHAANTVCTRMQQSASMKSSQPDVLKCNSRKWCGLHCQLQRNLRSALHGRQRWTNATVCPQILSSDTPCDPTFICHHVESGVDMWNVTLQVAFISPLATAVIRVTGWRLVLWTAVATLLGQCTVAAVAASAPHRTSLLALKVHINTSSTSVSPLTAAGP